MFERLQQIAHKYGIGAEALRELERLHEEAAPRVPTQRFDDGRRNQITLEPLAMGDFKMRYEDRGRIGLGGFSEVRRAWDRHVKRDVALKIQLPSLNSSDDTTRFREEVRIMALLQHPGIVPVHDWGEMPDGRIWFTMKLVHGETIRKQISQLHTCDGPSFHQTLRRLLDDYRRLCEPVAYAHAQNIIHRDISPNNLMVGKLGEVHVMDWGLARDLSYKLDKTSTIDTALDASTDLSETSIRTRIAGTPFYMPPEQARGEIRAMGPASDVYALGAVLYEILSGHPPYHSRENERQSPAHILDRVRTEPPQRIDEVARAGSPKELFQLCQKAMARDPSQRHTNAGELMAELRDWLDGANRRARARLLVEESEREHHSKLQGMREKALHLRDRARQTLEKLKPFDRAQEKAAGWNMEDDAAKIEQEALREEINWTQKLRSALNEAPDLEEAHSALASYYAQNLLRADMLRDTHAAMSYAALVQEHANQLRVEERARYDKLVNGDGRLTLITAPEHVDVVIEPYELVNRYLMPNGKKAITLTTPIREMRIPRGSYLLQLKASGHRTTRYPVHIGRDEHWNGIRPGDSAPLPIPLLRDDEMGHDDIYIPPGWFIAGGDPRAGEALSQRRTWIDGFVIRKYPVTNREYIEFLNALVDKGRLSEAQRHCPRSFPGAASKNPDELAYRFDETDGHYALRMPETERDLPVVSIDWYSAMAYAEYVARETGLDWRLPSEFEWEKAARGVDGRFLPWGDQLEPTWACVSGSHSGLKHAVAVDGYPTDVSPYGVRGLAGNVRDWCIDNWQLDGPNVDHDILRIDPAKPQANTQIPVRGGAWISVGDLMRICVRYSAPPEHRHGVVGFRLARSLRR